MSKLAVIALGHRKSGKTTTWNTLFGRTVRTGSEVRHLELPCGTMLPVFLVSGSPEERGMYVGKIVQSADSRVILCSVQYTDAGRDSLNYFFDNGFAMYVQWLNPGYSDDAEVPDSLGFLPYMLHRGATVSLRDGRLDPNDRVREIREFLCGWASTRRL
jgi:hypothetical protein